MNEELDPNTATELIQFAIHHGLKDGAKLEVVTGEGTPTVFVVSRKGDRYGVSLAGEESRNGTYVTRSGSWTRPGPDVRPGASTMNRKQRRAASVRRRRGA